MADDANQLVRLAGQRHHVRQRLDLGQRDGQGTAIVSRAGGRQQLEQVEPKVGALIDLGRLQLLGQPELLGDDR